MSTDNYLISMFIFSALFAGGAYLIYSARDSRGFNPGRRSLFVGRGEEDGEALFLGLQMAVRVFGTDSLRSRLADLIQQTEEAILAQNIGTAGGDKVSVAIPEPGEITRKRDFLKSITSLLIENRYAWEYGFWEFQRNAGEAIDQFNQWTNEIESSIASSGEEIGASPDQLHRSSSEKEFVVISILMLIDNREVMVDDDAGEDAFCPTYAGLATRFREMLATIGNDERWSPQTFEGILEAIRLVDPRSIARDAVFLLPGSPEDGVSALDLLADPGWKYLTDHPIRAT